jgi:hypothetical protein
MDDLFAYAMTHANKRVTRQPRMPVGSWPRLMRADTAAAYCDEKSVEAFLLAVGSIYPQPIKLSGKGNRWLKETLDQAMDRLARSAETIRDIADVL